MSSSYKYPTCLNLSTREEVRVVFMKVRETCHFEFDGGTHSHNTTSGNDLRTRFFKNLDEGKYYYHISNDERRRWMKVALTMYPDLEIVKK
jgi:hypothetical protein